MKNLKKKMTNRRKRRKEEEYSFLKILRLAQKRKRYKMKKKWILDFNEYITVSYTEKDIAVKLLNNHLKVILLAMQRQSKASRCW